MSIGASPTLGVNTLPELIALAKSKPGAISYSVAGVGRMTHLTGELLQIRADIKLQMVPYTGGAAQALSDIIAGRISMIVEGYAGMAGIYQAGSLKALAVGSAQRLPGAPHIPTVAETLPGFVAAGWQVVVAPKGTLGGDRKQGGRGPAPGPDQARHDRASLNARLLPPADDACRNRGLRAGSAAIVEARDGADRKPDAVSRTASVVQGAPKSHNP